MTRAGIVLTALLISTTPIIGRPIATPKPIPQRHMLLDLSNIHLHLFRLNSDPADVGSRQSAGSGSDWAERLNLPSLSLGALHAEFGTDDNPRAHLSTYELMGEDQLGNSVWHAQAGRTAKLLFIWPTDK